MDNFLTAKTFAATFLVIFGLSVIFVRDADFRVLVGALIASAGTSFFVRMTVVLRK